MEPQPPPASEQSSPPEQPAPAPLSSTPSQAVASSASFTMNPSTSTSNRQHQSSFQHMTPQSSSSLPSMSGLAIGVPAQQPVPSPQLTSFTSLSQPSMGQQFGVLGCGIPDSLPTSSSAQGRQPVQGMPGMGITGSLGSSMQMRPAGIPPQPVRSITASLRQNPSQNFQGHGMVRAPNTPTTPQSPQSQNQAWLSSGAQGKPPLPHPSPRSQLSSQQPIQQRTLVRPQQHHPVSTSQPQENMGQQQSSRIQQPISNQQQPNVKSQRVAVQKPSSSAAAQSGAPNKTEEPCNRILSKRSIQELVTQIDPSQRLDPEVEDIFVDIAEEFVESLTNFGCLLAKHRKSSTLEAKDILLHAERHWNITLPGFTGDEIRPYKKPLTTDIHRERLAVIKRSASKTTNPKNSSGQGGSSKVQFGKGPSNTLTSPNAKT